MKLHTIGSTLLGCVVFGATVMSVAAASPTDAPAAGQVVDVRTLGAQGDGIADDTDAFERAITQAQQTLAGAAVHVPPGRYRISRTLTLKSVRLQGATGGAWNSDSMAVPVLTLTNRDEPGLRLDAGGAVHGLMLDTDWGGQPIGPRPPAIELAGVGCRVTETKIWNAWDAILADGKNNVGRALIEKCFIVNVHNTGVRMTGTLDSSWISKVEVWSPGSETFLKQGVGFLLGQNDVLLMSDCFVFKAWRGYRFMDKIPGCAIKGGTWGSMSNCSADYSDKAISVEGTHTVSITGGTYWTHFGALRIEGAGAQVRVSGAELGANGLPAVEILSARAVTLSGCQIRRIMRQFNGPALRITGGHVAVTGNVIECSSRALDISRKASVTLIGNLVKHNLPDDAGVPKPADDDAAATPGEAS